MTNGKVDAMRFWQMIVSALFIGVAEDQLLSRQEDLYVLHSFCSSY